MTFDQPIFLVLLGLLPVLWWRMRKMPGASSACLALKCAVFAVLAIALADPWASMRMQKLAVTVLLDTSASMPRESLLHGEAMLRDLVRKNSGASLRLITFAGRPNLRPVPQQADKVNIPEGVDPKEGMSTDIEGAMQLALSTFPVQGARRILLISDGNENRGHALTAALRAREQGIAVFTVPAGGTAPLPVKVQSIASPQDVFSGERFTLSLQLDSAGAIPARVWITSQGREIGSAKADLHAGNNAVDVEARIAAAGFPVTPGAGDWDAVLLDNYPDHILSPEEDAALEKYVYAGGGLIFIAGNRNAKLAQEPKTPLEKMLPVRGAPPPEKPTAVVLVLDKSGSMSGPKIEMAREAARASIRTLRPIDKIGVISFDETFNWVIPMGPAGNLEDKSNLIGQITANGGTKIYQAVESAFEKIVIEQATHKHIILLTDGVSTPGTQEDFPRLEREARRRAKCISSRIRKRSRKLSTQKCAPRTIWRSRNVPCAPSASGRWNLSTASISPARRVCWASSRRKRRKVRKRFCAWTSTSRSWCAGGTDWAA